MNRKGPTRVPKCVMWNEAWLFSSGPLLPGAELPNKSRQNRQANETYVQEARRLLPSFSRQNWKMIIPFHGYHEAVFNQTILYTEQGG